jgi:hypothetical protein
MYRLRHITAHYQMAIFVLLTLLISWAFIIPTWSSLLCQVGRGSPTYGSR